MPHHPKRGTTEVEAEPPKLRHTTLACPGRLSLLKPGWLVTLRTAEATLLFSILKAEMEEAPMATGLPEGTYTQWMFINHSLYQTRTQGLWASGAGRICPRWSPKVTPMMDSAKGTRFQPAFKGTLSTGVVLTVLAGHT